MRQAKAFWRGRRSICVVVKGSEVSSTSDSRAGQGWAGKWQGVTYPRHWPDWTLLLQVYPPSSGDSYSRDAVAYPSAKTPSSAYPSPFYVAGAWGSLGGSAGPGSLVSQPSSTQTAACTPQLSSGVPPARWALGPC